MNTQADSGDNILRSPGVASATNRAATNGGDHPSAGAAGEFRSFIADIEDLIKATTSLSGEDLARAKAKLNARIAAAKTSAEQMGGAIAGRARQAAKATDGYVHENPWKAVGVGAAIGVLVGILVARR